MKWVQHACITKIWTLDKEYARVGWLVAWAMDCIPEDRYEFLQVSLMFWAGECLLQAYLKKLICCLAFEQGVLRARWRSWLWPLGTLWRGLLLQGIVSWTLFERSSGANYLAMECCQIFLSNINVLSIVSETHVPHQSFWDFGEENSEFSSAPSLSRQCTEFSDVVAQESWCSLVSRFFLEKAM